MKTRISALMDGELEGHEIAETLRALHRSPELRSEWCDCQLIGAALRGERGLGIDIAARVMSAIDLEPTVMAPAPGRRTPEWQRPVLALAASAAGVAVVAWLVLAAGGDGVPAGAAGLAGAKQGSVVAQSQSTPRMQEYLLAHQAYAPGGAIVSGARNIRTVAASGEGR
ncbi:MAG: sigma-E factor negative regulatory protein [Sulfuritalea sp.]|nr:sigma-E factor negative regulatory protein [Sulfuritalea sp.]